MSEVTVLVKEESTQQSMRISRRLEHLVESPLKGVKSQEGNNGEAVKDCEGSLGYALLKFMF